MGGKMATGTSKPGYQEGFDRTSSESTENEISFTPSPLNEDVNFTPEPPAEAPQAVTHSIDAASDRAKHVVDRASEGLKHTAANATSQIQTITRDMRERADVAKGDASQSLRKLAQNLREQVQSGDGQPVAQATSIAEQLDRMATYLEGNTFEDIEADARQKIQKNPWQSVGIAAFIGFILSRIFGGKR
jgi:ElaB/YqjD/DUF883 family membrane-anchored ribosome-binding protein